MRDGTLRKILEALAKDLEERAGLLIWRSASAHEVTLVEDTLEQNLLAEACAKPSPKDRANRYAIARGSALECGAIIDALLTLTLIPKAAHSEAKTLLLRIASSHFELL